MNLYILHQRHPNPNEEAETTATNAYQHQKHCSNCKRVFYTYKHGHIVLYQCERVHPTTMHVLRHSNKEAQLLSKKGDLLWALVHSQLPFEGEQ